MAAGDIGFSFSPSQSPDIPGQGAAGGGSRGISPQQAVKILSLRIPERPAPHAIAPLPLLNAQGSEAAGAQGLDSAVAALMRAFAPQPSAAGPQMPVMGGGGTPPFSNPGGPIRPDPRSPLPPVMQPPGLPVPSGEIPTPRPPNGTPPPRIVPRDDLPNVAAPPGIAVPAPVVGPGTNGHQPFWDTNNSAAAQSSLPPLSELPVSAAPSMPGLFGPDNGQGEMALQQLARRRGFFDVG